MAKRKPDKSNHISKPASTKKRKWMESTGDKKGVKRAKLPSGNPYSPGKNVDIKLETRECDVCAEEKSAYRNFPSLPTCTHDASVCSNCYTDHFVTRVSENRAEGWSACTCPACGDKVDQDAAQSILPRQVSKELNLMIKNAARQTAQNWIWCPGPACGLGQLHKSLKAAKARCKHCNFEICVKHQIKWHKGLTCHEYDEAGNHDAGMAKSANEIQRTTKACPFCDRRVEKNGGCNYMKCSSCRKVWLWDSVAFDGEDVPTTAEVKGGTEGHRPLTGAQRENALRVMDFENAIIDGGQPNRDPNHDPMRLQNFARLNITFATLPLPGRPTVPEDAIANSPQRHQHRRNSAQTAIRRVQTGFRAGNNAESTSSTSGPDDRRPHNVPVQHDGSDSQPTQTHRRRRRRRPQIHAGPRLHRPIDQRHELSMVVMHASDTSDTSADADDGGTSRNAPMQVQYRRKIENGIEVIDLTEEVMVVDLTGDE